MNAERKPTAVDYRACPPGATRGVDVARMYREIGDIVRSKFTVPDVEIDDLVQETAAAILVKNTSQKSAFDPVRASFGKYVYMVAWGKLSHMREKQHGDRLEFHDQDAVFDAVAVLRSGRAFAGNLEPRTIGNVVELLTEAADMAADRVAADEDTRYFQGFEHAVRSCASFLSEAFEDAAAAAPTTKRDARKAATAERCRELGERIVAILAFARRAVSTTELCAAVIATPGRVDRAVRELGDRVRVVRDSSPRTYELVS